ncbi:hypothetical protein SEPCBS119000_003408 [Sporothrix epigloea]|uniref:Uncharacterized protein n=1 Tax=Sporothrix epigloea TaxID=1892477 RepID=A0ABP0DNG4_9PEZI
MERYIRAQEPLAFMLSENFTMEEAREAYIRKKLEPTVVYTQQGGDGVRVTRNSPSVPAAIQQAEVTPILLELTWTVEEKFNIAVTNFSTLLYDTVAEELLIDGENAKEMVDRLRKRFAQKSEYEQARLQGKQFVQEPDSELARLQAVYRDMMREATYDNLEGWIQKWGLTMEMQIRDKLPHVQTNTWKIELAEKLHDLCRNHKGSNWLAFIASKIETEAHQMYEPANVEEIQELVEMIRLNASGHASNTAKGKGGMAFAASLDIAEDKDDTVKPSSRPETRPRGVKKRAASPNTREDESQSRPRVAGTVQLCVRMQDTALSFIMEDPKLKERYEAAKRGLPWVCDG